ncbi:MAG: SDR family NAD(P)-dependent oxidoreductase [Desulfobacterales bacterium]
MKSAAAPFQEALSKIPITPNDIEVYSNTTGEAYPADSDAARKLLGEHLMRPVDFVKEIENLYRSGIRTFVEIGPKSILTGLIASILQGRPFETVALDASAGRASGIADLARLICRLASLGYPLALSKWETPLFAPPKPRMNVLLSGTNYRKQKTEDRGQRAESRGQRAESRGQRAEGKGQRAEDREQKAEDRGHKTENKKQRIEDRNQNMMSKNFTKKSDFITDALRVVQEGLKSMQHLQQQTAQAHEKFLLSQTEANRALQEMMRSTQRLADRTLGPQSGALPAEPPANDDLIKTSMPAPEIEVSPMAPEDPADLAIPDDFKKSAQPSPSPTPWKLPQAMANGYLKDAVENERTEFGGQSRKDIESVMLEVVSRLTGYPAEMLGLDMDIEADLGIDSIKRVEILSALEEKLPDLPAVSPDIMGGLRTLGQIAEFMRAGKTDDDHVNRIESSPQAARPTAESEPLEPDETRCNYVTTAMLEVVSQLTGYPGEMLGLDMDIEADLGIDSIKRVEILSGLEEKMPHLPAVSPELVGTLKTLRQICEYLAQGTSTDVSGNPPNGLQPEASSEGDGISTNTSHSSVRRQIHPEAPQLPRSVVTVSEAPPASATRIAISEHKKVFVTEDNSGLAEEITEAFSQLGIKTVKISLDILKYKKQLPEAAGLVIVQDPASDRIHRNLKDAFGLTKFLAPNLIDSASAGGAVFATITRLDGAFGLRSMPTVCPAQGALAGLAKTAALEWPDVCCHAIDIAPSWLENRDIAATVVREIMSPGPVEIGLDGRRRCTLSLESKPFPTGSLNIDERDVVVISGGARGVTAAAARELAVQTRATLVLLGRSPNPFAEPAWLASIKGEAAVKKAIFKNEYNGRSATPAQIQQAYQRYAANREISENLSRLKTTGAKVHYYSVDVRNSNALGGILEKVRSRHGSITGIIHGAGVLEDRLIIDKTSEQFERVYATKVMGLENLLQATRTDPLKYIVLFSSVAARFGNKGQVDYAMANEALNKIAAAESAGRADCRVVSINWGPWDGGMVTSALKREFERSGIHLISPESGAGCMLREMAANSGEPVEIVIGAELKGAVAPYQRQLKRPALVEPAAAVKKQRLAFSFEREIDLRQYPVLESHVIDGKPVVPLALMIEWFAHGALHENPGLFFHGLDDVRVMKGIRLEHDRKRIRLLAGKPKKIGEFFEVEVELRDADASAKDIIHAKALAVLSDRLIDAPAHHVSANMFARAFAKKMDEVYDGILFHGPQLHAIRRIISCSSRGMMAHISVAPAPDQWLAAPLRNNWIADPLVLDGAFQMATVWCFEEKGIVSLPSYFDAYRQYCNKFPNGGVKVILEIKETANRKMRGDFTFLDSNDEMVARLSGYEAVMDASLMKAFKPQYRASA